MGRCYRITITITIAITIAIAIAIAIAGDYIRSNGIRR